MAKIYDPLQSIDAELPINTREYTLYLRDLQNKFGTDLSKYFMPISFEWWAQYLKYVVLVKTKTKANKSLNLFISKRKIEQVVQSLISYTDSKESNEYTDFYEDNSGIYMDEGFDDEENYFPPQPSRQYSNDYIDRPPSQPGSKGALVIKHTEEIKITHPGSQDSSLVVEKSEAPPAADKIFIYRSPAVDSGDSKDPDDYILIGDNLKSSSINIPSDLSAPNSARLEPLEKNYEENEIDKINVDAENSLNSTSETDGKTLEYSADFDSIVTS